MNSNTKDALCEFSMATTEALLLLGDVAVQPYGPLESQKQLIHASRVRVTAANKNLKLAIATDDFK